MTSPDLATLVTDFFVRHLASERNVSPHTAAAYRDALKLLLRFARDVAHRSVAALRVEDLTPDLVLQFLAHVESVRHNSVRTRNARLAAIHSFFRYILTSLTAIPSGRPRVSGCWRFPSRRPRAPYWATSPNRARTSPGPSRSLDPQRGA
jgi:integrase